MPIIYTVRESLAGATEDCALSVVIQAFSVACEDYLLAERERRVLSTYRMTLDEFRREGLHNFGEIGFADLRQRVESIVLDCDFLVCGFDTQGEGHIFTVAGQDGAGRPGLTIENHDRPGFYAIGSGKASAMSMLFHYQQNITKEIESTIYNVCAAKFMAETAPGVGRQTWCQTMRSTTTAVASEIYLDDAVAVIRAEWDRTGRPRVPDNITATIKSMVTGNNGTTTGGF